MVEPVADCGTNCGAASPTVLYVSTRILRWTLFETRDACKERNSDVAHERKTDTWITWVLEGRPREARLAKSIHSAYPDALLGTAD